MKRLVLSAVILLLFVLWIVVKPDVFNTSNNHGSGKAYTSTLADEATLQQAIERLQRFEEELKNEGFREVTVSHATSASDTFLNRKRLVKLEGRYPDLGKVTVEIWTNTHLDIEEPHVGAGFDAMIRDTEAAVAFETLDERFKKVVWD